MRTHLLMGNPIDGFALVGPFADSEAAIAYGSSSDDYDWWIIEASEPDEASQ